MKNLSLLTHISKTVIALALLFGALFLLASCEKEETVQTSSTLTATENAKQIVHGAASTPRGFAIIKIEHVALESDLPDYVVTAFSNGKFTFEGRKNVHTIGKVTLDMDDKALLYLEAMTKDFNFLTF